MDIIVAKIKFPNDPTNKKVARQLFVGFYDVSSITFYSVSSILGKEYRVYGSENHKYYTITGKQQTSNFFKKPSFIDCSKGYKLNTTASIHFTKLTHRQLDTCLKNDILTKINELKINSEHTEYLLDSDEFLNDNPMVK